MLSEISLTQKDKYHMIFYVVSKNVELTKAEWLLGIVDQRKRGDAVGQSLQIFSYKMNNFWDSNVQQDDYS